MSSVGRNHDKRRTFASVLVGRRRKGTQSEPEATAERERNASDSIDPTAKKLRFPFDAIKPNAPTGRGFYRELRETRPEISHIICSSKLGRSSRIAIPLYKDFYPCPKVPPYELYRVRIISSVNSFRIDRTYCFHASNRENSVNRIFRRKLHTCSFFLAYTFCLYN